MKLGQFVRNYKWVGVREIKYEHVWIRDGGGGWQGQCSYDD